MHNYLDVVILGGGIAGLGAAANLPSGKYISHALLEQSDRVGGTARTLRLNDGLFDLGVHGIFQSSADTADAYNQMVGFMEECDYENKEALSAIFYRNRTLRYPFSFRELFVSLSPQDLIRSFFLFLLKRADRRLIKGCSDAYPSPTESYEDWMIKCFGKGLYDCFFEEYAMKVWGVHPSRLLALQVARRIKTPSVWLAIVNAVKYSLGFKEATRYTQVPRKYIYCYQGCGFLTDSIAEHYMQGGGKVFLNTHVDGIENVKGDWIVKTTHSDGRRINFMAKYIISSLPITMLAEAIGETGVEGDDKLLFRHTIFVNLLISKTRVFDDYQWVYFQEKKYPFMRINEYANIISSMACSRYSVINAEIESFENDETWKKSDDEIAGEVVDILVKLKVLNFSNIIETNVMRVLNTYPVFTIGAKAVADRMLSKIDKSNRIWSIGRCGRFCYANMDEAYKMGMDAASDICRLIY